MRAALRNKARHAIKIAADIPPSSHACQSTILPLSVSQAVASCQTAAVVCHATVLPHTICRGLAVSLTLLCRLSSSHLTTTRSAKGQAGPSTRKREGDICNPRSQSHSCSNTMHACNQTSRITCTCISRTMSVHRAIASARRIKRSVASTTSRLNSHHRGVKPENISRPARPHISRTRTSPIEISLALCLTALFFSPKQNS